MMPAFANPREWMACAFSGPVVRRATLYALVVGAILIAINHSDALASGRIEGHRWLRMGLTVLVPYCVSTLSSVGATLEARRRGGSGPARREG